MNRLGYRTPEAWLRDCTMREGCQADQGAAPHEH